MCLLQVLVGAHAVLANGGVIAPSGVHMVALAAKRHSIPFVVLVGLHKLSPLFPHDPDVTFNGGYLCMLCSEAGVVLVCALYSHTVLLLFQIALWQSLQNCWLCSLLSNHTARCRWL